MTLYELLGVDKTANATAIKAAYRKLAKKAHPDQGGDAEEFRKLKEAFEILTDPARRTRYDLTGRTDDSKVNEKSITNFIEQTITACVEAEDKNGMTDDPVYEDIRQKILTTFQKQRVEIKDKRFKVERKVRRARELLARFKRRNPEGQDLIGDALRKNLTRLQGEANQLDDMAELSQEAEKVFREYSYEVGPRPEGQYNQGPTTRRSGVMFLDSKV